MCGINGFNWKDQVMITKMNKAIKHRGPDDEGSYINDAASLGHVRLSILDLSNAGHQPMFYSKNNGACSAKHNKSFIDFSKLCIIFNGEIYNYIEIRKDLKDKGYNFTTESDTEVILAAYLEYGTDCVKQFNGMWAFCIYDEEKQILFLSRDRLGQKPLYYFLKEGKFIFSSEIKGILKHHHLKINREKNISKKSVDLYFALGFIPSPYSIYKNIFKLEASHNLIFDLKTKQAKKEQYFEIDAYKPITNEKKLIKEGRELLRDAVKLRMRSDVPVGSFLSGGLDSSTVVGIMKELTDIDKIHTFSIGFENEYDETRYINIVKDYFGTRHHHYYFKKKDFEKLIGKYSEIYDEPFADFSGYPMYVVCRMAKKFVTVSLSGDGGDEIFGGYANHIAGSRMDLIYMIPRFLRAIISKIPVKKNLNKFASSYLLVEAFRTSLYEKKYLYAKAIENEGIKPEAYQKWTKEKLDYSLHKGGNKLGEAMRIHDLMFNSLADNFLVKVDRASMATALEVRSPFLDYRFIKYSQKIPTKWKQDIFKTKKIMRKIISGIVPKEIVRRGKQGFTPPLEKWILEKENIEQIKNFNEKLKKLHPELSVFFSTKVLPENNKIYSFYKIRLFIFGKWMERWIKS